MESVPSESRSTVRAGQVPGSGQTGNMKKLFTIEKLVDKRVREGVLEYYVKWIGFESKFNTWEPFKTLMEDCPHVVQNYEAEREQKVKQEVVKQLGFVKNERGSEDSEQIGSNETGESTVDNAEENGNGGDDSHQKDNNPDGGDHDDTVAGEGEGRAEIKQEHTSKKVKQEKFVKQEVPDESLPHGSNVNTGRRKKSPEFIPGHIIGATPVQVGQKEEVYFLVRCKNSEKTDLIPAKQANISCPQLVIKFYQDRLQWDGVQPHHSQNTIPEVEFVNFE